MEYNFTLSSLEFIEKREITNKFVEITDGNRMAITGYAMNSDMNDIKNITNSNKESITSAFSTVFPKLMSDSEELNLLCAIDEFMDNMITIDVDTNEQ